MIITSMSNRKIKEVCKLKQKKYRDNLNMFLVEGHHLIEEAKKADVLLEIYTTIETFKGDNVYYVTEEVLNKLTDTVSPQGVIGVCKKTNDKFIGDKVLILDHIQDPGNLGTLLRSAVAFQFNTIVLDDCVDLYNAKVIRSTQGNIFKLNYVFQDVIGFMKDHTEHCYYGTSLDGISLDHVTMGDKMAIILGNEGKGVQKDILDSTNQNILIEMNDCESLNVGVAGSIIMYHFR